MSSESYHEPIELLSEGTKNMHRALVSLREELEAVDWYQQRAEACSDAELRAILTHNKNEEIEHAMMTLEWLRRNNAVIDDNLKTYLNTTGPITGVEAAKMGVGDGESPSATSPTPPTSLGIGSLKGKR
jgi:ferritin-like protein